MFVTQILFYKTLPFEATKGGLEKTDIFLEKRFNYSFFYFELKPEVYFHIVSDSYSKVQTRGSVESGKNSLEYESFEYESRLDTPLVDLVIWNLYTYEKKGDCTFKSTFSQGNNIVVSIY